MRTKDVDFVLVSSSARKDSENENSLERKRSIFEENLVAQGLQMEKETYGCLTFLKLHAPETVLKRYCEIMNFRMPIKKIPQAVQRSAMFERKSICKTIINMLKSFGNYLTSGDITTKSKTELKATYSREKAYLFDEDNENFFTFTIRILIVHYILNRQTLDGEDPVGLEKLISDNVYIAAYPLHDGDYKDEHTDRGRLYENWCKLKNWNRKQPIDLIQKYLGTKIAFYFSWLGFYTRLLVLPSFFGILVLLYGYFTLPADRVSQDTCNSKNVTMCPSCDYVCDYYELSDNCLYSKITYLFDNNFTAIFALLMAIWASTFFETWKRYEAVLTHRWSLMEYSVDEELPRPEYIAKVNGYNEFKLNEVTEKKEPVLPLWRVKIPARIMSYTTILFFIMLVVIAVVAIMMYKIWIATVLNSIAIDKMPFLKPYTSFIVSGTSASFNLISIMALNVVYSKVAVYLTKLECHRTHTEHETALTIKIYIFQFINYYSSIMYIAFFKGKFIGYPGEFLKIFGHRQEECSYGGCLLELSIQLAFIMIGKQIFGAIFEMSVPAMKTSFKEHQSESDERNLDISLSTELNDLAKAPSKLRWIEDFKLLDWEEVGLFSEYLEMVIQFGFVTLFVPAFPLAPLFAFLNNKFEIRLDAKKILTYYRRPIPYRIPGIGVWFQILQFVGSLAVLTNAIVIAFSSSFIPKLVYSLNNNGSDENFLINSLSEISVEDLDPFTRPTNSSYNISYCRYADFREPPNSIRKYDPTRLYWQVFIARLIFIILFQNITYAVKSIIDYWVPDEPEELHQLIKKENYLTTQLIIENETRSMTKMSVNSTDETDDADYETSTSSSLEALEKSLDIGVSKMKIHSNNDT